MTTADFVLHLERLGVTLAADGDRLRCEAPAGVLTPELRSRIAGRKAEILAALAAGPPAAPQESSGSIPRAPRGERPPLSFAQRRLWFLDRLEPGHPFYNAPAALRLSGRLDAAALEEALNRVARRHEALRTTFGAHDGEPFQTVAPSLEIPLERLDLSGRPAGEREAEARRAAHEFARQPFDLARGPLLRALLVRLAAEEHHLLLLLHHIVCDNWSVHTLLRETFGFYGDLALGRRFAPAEPRAQYADYAAWERRRLDGDETTAELSFWRDRLSGAPDLLSFPGDRPRPAVQSYRGAAHRFRVPAGTVERLRALARAEQATLFMPLLAAFGVLLWRHTGATDLVIGSPVAGRTRAELEDVVGCFANTLPLRLDLSGEPTFRGLLRRVRMACLEAYAHQEMPFERLVESLAPARSLGHAPIVQTVFQLLNAPAARLGLDGLAVAPMPLDTGTSKFDLTLFLREVPGGLEGTAEYATDLYDRGTIERAMRRYGTLLEAAATSADAPAGDLPILDEEEHRTILVRWNDTRVSYPDDDAPLHRLFAAQAARTPDATAVVLEGSSLTFAALEERADRLARHLIARHAVGPETTVGVCMERSLEMVVALLGVLEAGGAYLPLDPSDPPARLAGMIAEAAPRAILTHAPAAASLPPGTGAVLHLDDDGTIPAREPAPAPPAIVRPDHPAYVLYTSGSTGRPKGVVIPHRGVLNRLLWMQEAFALTPDDRILQKTPFGFDVSVWEFFWPLLVGARLVLARPGGHREPAYLARLIDSERITVAHFVPSLLDAFLQEPGLEDRCASLRLIVCSGEALSPSLQRRCLARLPRAELHNLYGPTEASIDATAWRCGPAGDDVVPIGRPIANMQAYVLDRRMRPAPIGVSGELYLGGVGLARGYLARPDLTAAAFVPHPFGPPGARLYRTGDLARCREDGALEYLGRRDGQVKLRGVRVELGEIEAVLRERPDVRAAVVAVRRVAPGDDRLVAYVVPARGAAIDAAATLAALRRRLPQAMQPAALLQLEDLPVSPNGKLDRRALPDPDWGREAGGAPAGDGEAPSSPVEVALTRIWKEVLRVGTVGRHDDFFALGGHSLLAVQVASRIRSILGVEVPVRLLFVETRLAQLAEAVERLRASGGTARGPALVPLARGAGFSPAPAPGGAGAVTDRR